MSAIVEMSDRKEFEEQSRQRPRRWRGSGYRRVPRRTEGRAVPRRREESAEERSIRRGADTNCGEHLGNTRGSTMERLERTPRDLSLIGGARPADWLTSKTLHGRDTLVSPRFTIGPADERHARDDRRSRRPADAVGPYLADWQRNPTEIGPQRSISFAEEIHARSNSHSGLGYLGK